MFANDFLGGLPLGVTGVVSASRAILRWEGRSIAVGPMIGVPPFTGVGVLPSLAAGAAVGVAAFVRARPSAVFGDLSGVFR
jgi:hypothetical protein